MVGKKLSHYLIEAELGRGGMGIVYRAEDTKLDRTVAIKVLPSAALASEDDRARFYREAKAAAQLHHPHIASVFEIDEAVPEGSNNDDLRPFIAMEYIQGETLHDRIQKGPLKLEEAVRIASEIASGLEAAHEKEIVHRDIKSANVMLTSKGSAKVLDFGLAQTAASTKLTRLGSTLGTIAYMSPEQATGSEVDGRTDIWSLGVILYEMISGQSPFPGSYDKAIIYSILNQDAEPLTALRTGVPIELERITAKCMAKEAKARYQSATDLIVDLENVDVMSSRLPSVTTSATHLSPPYQASATEPDKPSFLAAAKRAWPLIAAAVLVTAGLGYLAFSESPNPLETGRYSLNLSPDQSIGPMAYSRRIASSPDGRYIAYQSGQGSSRRIYIRATNERTARVITPEADVTVTPFFSPDSREVGYYDYNSRELKRIALPDGSPQVIATVVGVCCSGVTWGPNETIVYSLFNSGLFEQPLDGGAAKPLTKLDSLNSERTHRHPQFIAGTNDLLFTIGKTSHRRWDEADIGLYLRESNEHQIILSGGRDAHYVPTGHLVYGNNESLLVARFDLQTHTVENPVRVVESVAMSEIFGQVDYAFDNTGRLLYLKGGRDEETSRLAWYDRRGNFVGVEDSSLIFRWARISPDANNILLWLDGQNGQVWIRDRSTGTNEPFTTRGSNQTPVWSPNGDSVAYYSSNEGGGIFIEPADRSSPAKKITSGSVGQYTYSWSPNGAAITFTTPGEDGLFDVGIFDFSGVPVRTLSEEGANLDSPKISPDGIWLAYGSDEAGHAEIYIRRLSDFSDKRRISVGGGTNPVWNPDGRELFYLNDTSLISASLNLNAGIPIERNVLFDLDKIRGRINGYDYDGLTEEFLFILSDPFDPIISIEVVVNWFEELNRLVPISN